MTPREKREFLRVLEAEAIHLDSVHLYLKDKELPVTTYPEAMHAQVKLRFVVAHMLALANKIRSELPQERFDEEIAF